MTQTKRAWRASYGGLTAIYPAESRGKAGGMFIRGAGEVYGKLPFKGLRIRRAQEFDAWAATDVQGRGWDEAILRETLSHERR